jgi:sugar/nucleoside kinase (ribokinase family)
VRLVAVGDVMVDVQASQLPPPGGRVHAELSLRAGGSAVNAAAAAAAAGASATVIGRVGSDPAGELLTAELERLGIEAHLSRDADLPTGMTVALGHSSEASVVATRGANERLVPGDIPEVIEVDALYVSGYALFQKGSSEGAQAALDRFGGGWAAVDVGSPALAAAAGAFEPAERRRTLLLATADEARAMTGEEPEEAARTLASRFAVACIKLGDRGALAAAGDRLERCVVASVARRSPFGAGDAFGAVLLIALAADTALDRALASACEAGARAAAGGSQA